MKLSSGSKYGIRIACALLVLLVLLTASLKLDFRAPETMEAAHPAVPPPPPDSSSSPTPVLTAPTATVHTETSIKRGPHNRRVFPQLEQTDLTSREDTLFASQPFRVLGQDSSLRADDPHIIRSVSVALDPEFAHDFIASGARRFNLPVNGTETITVRADRVIARGEHTHTIIGSVTEDPLSEVILVFNGRSMGGSLVLQRSNTHYEFGASRDGSAVVRQIDPATYTATCGVDDEHEHAHADHADPEELHGAESPMVAPAQSTGPGTAGTILDSVIGYGRQAREDDGGVDAIEARILASVDRMNLAFANSNVSDIEVVLMATIEDPDYEFPGQIDGEMGSSDELGDLRDAGDGRLDAVSDLRIELGADQLGFVITSSDDYAGIAYQPGYAMIVVRNYLSSAGLVFAHEMGHNIGCRHAWGDSSSDNNKNVSNTGWRFIGPIVGERRTVMAYSSWTRVTHYSNPDVLVDGVATGAVTGYDASDDPTVDPRLVSGGFIGSLDGGFDGSNSNLGANNAQYIQFNAQYLADNADRTNPIIQLEAPAGNALDNIFGNLVFKAETLSAPVVHTLTIRNIGDATISGLNAELERNDLAAFSLGTLSATSLAPDGTATLDVSYTPADEADETVRLRLSSSTSSVPDAVISLTGIYDPPRPVIQVEYPAGQALKDNQESFTLTATTVGDVISRTFTVRNIGELDLSGLQAEFSNNTGGAFSAGSFSSTTLAPGATTEVTVFYEPTEAGLENVVFQILSNDPETPSFRIGMAGSLNGPIYAESFEDGLGIWSNTGDRDWQTISGNTPSYLTGPDGAYDGSYYIYIEATGSGSSVFSLQTDFDLSGYSTAELRFRYYMYGSYTGTLNVDVFDGTWHNAIWTLTGEQQEDSDEPWGLGSVDLDDYAGDGIITVRFRAQTLGVSYSDISIDAIELSADPITYTLSYSAGTGGTISGIANQTVAAGENGTPVEAVPDSGYSFLSWSDDSTDNPRTDLNISANLSVSAEFKPDAINYYADWKLGRDFPGDADEPQDSPLDDGVSNLLRYAFNLSPDTRGPLVMTPLTGTYGLPHIRISETSDDLLEVELLRRKNAVDLTYRVQFADSLDSESWAQSGTETSVTPIDADWERVVIRDTVEMATDTRRFARVLVEIVEN